jgi:hypothetical protein
MLAESRRTQPGVEGAGERAVVALDQASRAALSARTREHGVVEAALVGVEGIRKERRESRHSAAHS